MESICSSETSVDFQRIRDHVKEVRHVSRSFVNAQGRSNAGLIQSFFYQNKTNSFKQTLLINALLFAQTSIAGLYLR
jgi:hypothetical protein